MSWKKQMENTTGDSQIATTDKVVEFLHDFRKQIDACIQIAESHNVPGLKYGREMSLVRTKLQEAKMWCGKCLEVWGSPFPENLRDKAEEKK